MGSTRSPRLLRCVFSGFNHESRLGNPFGVRITRFSRLLLRVVLAVVVIPAIGWGQAEDATETPKDEVTKPGENAGQFPLQNLIRGIFRPGARPATPDSEGKKSRGINDRDHIDGRAPQDRKAQEAIRAAEAAIQKKDWKNGIDLLQRLLDEKEDSLYRRPNGQWESIRLAAQNLIAKAPDEVRESYKQRYGPLAQQLLKDATKEGRIEDLVPIVSRFYHTDAGLEAANRLAITHFDRGEFHRASELFERLLAVNAPVTNSMAWKARALAARSRSGLAIEESRKPANPLNVGGESLPVEEWITRNAPQNTEQKLVVLQNTLNFMGTSSRTGVANSGPPLLIADHAVPFTSASSLRSKLDLLANDLADSGRIAAPAGVPIAVDGKIVWKDLRGIKVADVVTGKILWESPEGMSAERMMTGQLPPQLGAELGNARNAQNARRQMLENSSGMGAEYDPLTSLLIRDGLFCQVGSDGESVFNLEEHGILSGRQPGQHWGWNGEDEFSDPFGIPWGSNRIAAYDLKTGRPKWTLGGAPSNDLFKLPLTGAYFYGVPVADGPDLFVVYGQGDEIRLAVLEKETGKPRWTQLIAFSDSSIEKDIGRRWWSSPVAVSQGVVICPTTMGWLVAVDRLQHSVVWAHRFAAVNSEQTMHMNEDMMHMVSQADLNSRWYPSAPIIVGNKVIYAPREGNMIVCLNLSNGQRLWSTNRNSSVSVVGVADDTLVLLGPTEVRGVKLADGSNKWTTALEGGSPPIGRGLLTNESLLIPIRGGELREYSLANGKLTQRIHAANGQISLGNLIQHRGKLISFSLSGLSIFPQKETVLAEIQARKEKNSHDPVAILKEAEIHVLNREYTEAASLLNQSPIDQVPNALQKAWRKLLIESLTNIVRADLKKHPEALAQLKTLANSPEDRFQTSAFLAQQQAQSGQFAEAIAIFEEMISSPGPTQISRADDSNTKVERQCWLSGQIFELWRSGDEPQKTLFTEHLRERLSRISANPTAEEIRWLEVYQFHPMVLERKWILIDELLARKKWAPAEIELLRMASSSDPATRARAELTLAEFYLQAGWIADAQSLLKPYLEENSSTELATLEMRPNLSAHQWAARIRDDFPVDALAVIATPNAWEVDTLKQQTFGHQYYHQPDQALEVTSGSPATSQLLLDLSHTEGRLSIRSAATGSMHWYAPLRTGVKQDSGQGTGTLIGHQLAVNYRGGLQLLNIPDRQLSWARTLDSDNEGSQNQHYGNMRAQLMTMSTPNSHQSRVLERRNYQGRIVAANPQVIAFTGRRRVTVIDTLTGMERWRKTNLPSNVVLLGSDHHIFALNSEKQSVSAFRMEDGQPIPLKTAASAFFSQTLQIQGDDLILWDAQRGGASIFGLARTKAILRRVNPVTDSTVWKLELPSATMLGDLDSQQLLAILPTGDVQVIHTKTGEVRNMEAIPGKDVQSRNSPYCFADAERIYFTLFTPGNNNEHIYAHGLNTIRVGGPLYAWNRATGKLDWKVKLPNQHLIVDRVEQTPVLFFLSQGYKQKGNQSYNTLSMLVLNKRTGKTLLDHSSPSGHDHFNQFQYRPEIPALEVGSYNKKIRIVPFDPQKVRAQSLPDDSEKKPVTDGKTDPKTDAGKKEGAAKKDNADGSVWQAIFKKLPQPPIQIAPPLPVHQILPPVIVEVEAEVEK